MKTYRVTAQRSGESWILDVPDLSVGAEAKELSELPGVARAAIAAALEAHESDVKVDVRLLPTPNG